MRQHAEQWSRKAITFLTHLTKKRLPADLQKPTWAIAVCTLLLLGLIGFYTGLFTGASQVSTTATVVPLLFGLLTALMLNDVNWIKLAAMTVFLFTFAHGHKLGQHIDEPLSVRQMLQARGHLDSISNPLYNELLLLDAQMRSLGLEGSRHNAILYGVGATLVEDATISDTEKLEVLKRYRAELHEMK